MSRPNWARRLVHNTWFRAVMFIMAAFVLQFVVRVDYAILTEIRANMAPVPLIPRLW